MSNKTQRHFYQLHINSLTKYTQLGNLELFNI
jgi:hypothetical protein